MTSRRAWWYYNKVNDRASRRKGEKSEMAKEISVISAQDFLKCCRAGTLCGAYLLFGDEEYMKRSCVEASRKALLEEGTEAFNQTTINAVEDKAWADTLAEAVTSLPVFAEKRLCELHSLDYNKLSENQLSDLGTILAFLPDNEQSVVVMDALAEEFDAGRLPKAPSKQFRALSVRHVRILRARKRLEARRVGDAAFCVKRSRSRPRYRERSHRVLFHRYVRARLGNRQAVVLHALAGQNGGRSRRHTKGLLVGVAHRRFRFL